MGKKKHMTVAKASGKRTVDEKVEVCEILTDLEVNDDNDQAPFSA